PSGDQAVIASWNCGVLVSRLSSSPSTAFTHTSAGSVGSMPLHVNTTKLPSTERLGMPSAPGNDVTVRIRSDARFLVTLGEAITTASVAQMPSTTIAPRIDHTRDLNVGVGRIASTTAGVACPFVSNVGA